MEVYVLDDQFRREHVIDRFQSLVWTERYNEVGDFKLEIYSELANRDILTKDRQVIINLSKRMMTIETIEDKVDSEGRSVLVVAGRSFESVLEDRVAYSGIPLGAPSPWELTGTPANILRSIFYTVCITNSNTPEDILPNTTTGNFYPSDTNPEPDDVVALEIDPSDMLSVFIDIAQEYRLGFRYVRNPNNNMLYFNVYTGNDRTSTQNTLPPTIFSPSLESLSNISELFSVENHKNIAYVYAGKGQMAVYGDDFDSASVGFNRKVLMVDASDIELTPGPELDAAMLTRGKSELAKHRPIIILDGEVPAINKYVYDQDYGLGDYVELRSDRGTTNKMRVIEQIFSDDENGEKSYPTLELEALITPGSWLDWDYNIAWEDAEPLGTWDDQD